MYLCYVYIYLFVIYYIFIFNHILKVENKYTDMLILVFFNIAFFQLLIYVYK